MLALNAVSFIKVAVISPSYISIQTFVKKIENQKIIKVGVTANMLLEKSIPSNTQ